MQDATDYASSGPIFLFLSSPFRILSLSPSLISLWFLSGLCSERRLFFFCRPSTSHLSWALFCEREKKHRGSFFFFFFEFSCVRITRRCCCCCCFCLTLFSSHRRTTQSLISALKYTKVSNKRRKNKETGLRRRFLDFLFYSTCEAPKPLEFFFLKIKTVLIVFAFLLRLTAEAAAA